VSTEPPYRRIAAEIVARIDNGELGPGDRVPSTRAIIRQWGVAMATATKVIATLRDQGLVETTQGSGTVVRGSAPRPVRHEPELTKERIVRAAVAIADTEGIGALSMRRVATQLGVATMSLYRHVPGKDDLHLLMVDTVAGDFPFPERRPRHWRATLEFAARLLWTMFKQHPWGAELLSMTRPQLMPNLLDYAEWTLGALSELKLDMNTTMNIYLTLFGHVRSTALNLHAETQAEQDTGMTADEFTERHEPELRELLASGRYPTFARVVRQSYDFNLDALFEFGLVSLLDGVEVLLRKRARRG
jgi:DNA-binding transcriptional regulator YhcF (GntR family)